MRELLPRILELARRASPDEACGVIVAGPHSVAVRAMRNVAACPRTSFELDPGELAAVLGEVESQGGRIAALYHSHPRGPAVLSPRDRSALAPGDLPLLPGTALLVVGESGALGVYFWDAGRRAFERFAGDFFAGF